MNVLEYGNYLRIEVGEDISSRVNSLILKSPAPVVTTKTLTASEGVVVGTQALDAVYKTYAANEYIEFQIRKGDVFIAGDWKARLLSESADGLECKLTDWVEFTVVK